MPAGDRGGGLLHRSGDLTMSYAYNVLFLCTGNSARSILAEAILAREGAGRFRAFSAGSHPKGKVHPYALELLQRLNHDTGFARSKSWDEFAGTGAPQMDIIITVCDQAAGEQCPYWPGHPMTAHWALPDPAAATGSEAEKRRAFAEAYDTLERRISALVALPINACDEPTLRRRLYEIGQDRAAAEAG
jgi:protein-tyrosine-phosphatase